MHALRLIATFVLVIACSLGEAVDPVGAKQVSDAALEAQCRPYFHNACSEAMGRWLPNFGFREEWGDRAKRVDKRDDFAYGGGRASLNFLGSHGPTDGTLFVYGSAGPPKGHVLYDRAHRIAFYDQGCCSWHDMVAAADTPAPPKAVKESDLRNLSTVRGIRLGQTQNALETIYGRTPAISVAGHPGVTLLSYTTWPPKSSQAYAHTMCGQTQEFFFRRNRLILIQIGNGC